jgi:hypothetical protein
MDAAWTSVGLLHFNPTHASHSSSQTPSASKLVLFNSSSRFSSAARALFSSLSLSLSMMLVWLLPVRFAEGSGTTQPCDKQSERGCWSPVLIGSPGKRKDDSTAEVQQAPTLQHATCMTKHHSFPLSNTLQLTWRRCLATSESVRLFASGRNSNGMEGTGLRPSGWQTKYVTCYFALPPQPLQQKRLNQLECSLTTPKLHLDQHEKARYHITSHTLYLGYKAPK